MKRRALLGLAVAAAWALATSAAADPGAADLAPVMLTIDARGRLTFDGHPVAEDALRSAAEALVLRRPDVAVVIAADASMRYATIVRLMDILHAAGITRLSLAAAPDAPPP